MDKSRRQRALKVQLPNCSGSQEINLAQTAPSLIVLSRVIHVTLLFLCSVPPETRECVCARLLPTHPYGSASNEAFTRAVGRNFLNIAQKKTIRPSRLIKPHCFISNPTAGDLSLLCLFVNEVLCLFFLLPPFSPLEEEA